jgi:stage II sporulation protein D
MKQVTYITILLVVIPFFIVVFFATEKKYNETKKDDIIIDSEVIVRVKREATGEIETINLEEYVVGVVAGEMPVHFHIEALKAQAVAARSYVLKRIDYNKERDYDVVDTVMHQVYLDNDYLVRSWKNKYEEHISKIRSAVLITKGEYIEYGGKIADALYFSTSNGFTENSEEIFGFEAPYLRSVESAWDKKTSPVFNDNKKYTLQEFYKQANIPYKEKIDIKVLKKSSTGRIMELEINNKKMTGSELAKALKLRSNHFEIIQDEKEVFINTTGFGHGVGMSQYGALGMAEDGYLYDEILSYYYKGTRIGVLQ